MNKLVLAIINNEDSAIVASALTAEGFVVTKLSTTGGFLMVGNTTLLIGTDEGHLDLLRSTISKYCSKRKQINPSSAAFGRSMKNYDVPEEVVVGGATIFVLDVASMEKL